MNTAEELNLIRFINVTRKKEGLFANFRVKGVRGGMTFKASLSVDISACNVDPADDSLEKLIEACAAYVVKEMKRIDFQFEGLQAL
jgi:hypothetical protein